MALCVEVRNKKRLQKTNLTVKEVFSVNNMIEWFLEWRIDKFNSMKKNVNYSNEVENSDCILTITKKRRLSSVTLSTPNYNEDITCFVCYNKEVFSNSITAHRSTGEVRSFTISDALIHVEQNMFLKENVLVLHFKLNKATVMGKPQIRSKVYGTPTRDYLHVMYMKCFETRLADFIIYVKPKALEAHKAIIASRSSYFRQYIQEKCRDGEPGEIELDTTTHVITKILLFIYQGSISFKSNEECVEICKMSERLGILDLEIICKKYIAFYTE